MKNKVLKILFFLIVGGVVLLMYSCSQSPEIQTYETSKEAAKVKPDYTGLTIPPNIAPLNFSVMEDGEKYTVRISQKDKEENKIEIVSKSKDILIPHKQWSKLLKQANGSTIQYEILVKNDNQKWIQYQKFSNTVAKEMIDPYIAYRFMKPIYTWWKDISIQQKNLENHETRLLMSGMDFKNGCINCHSFINNKPETFALGYRSTHYGVGTLYIKDKHIEKIGNKWGYTAWHPSGKLAAYSLNKVFQFFHTAGIEIRDVIDLDSAIAYYDVETRQTETVPALSDKNRMETYPCWTPDGKYLYFCSGEILWENRNIVPPKEYAQVRYDLMRVGYDLENNCWGQAEIVISSKETGKSIMLPRISPDGKYLLFCMCDYGCFPIFQPSSDLYLLEISSGQYKHLDINSDYSESWHSWSSNSHWVAFSSKRNGGNFTRTFLSYVDEEGKFSKPFIMPQQDPSWYDRTLETFSVPEFITGAVEVCPEALAMAAMKKDKIESQTPISGATPKTKPQDWEQIRE
ncbi:MAG: PD40 domain-containing protein [Phycisphaerae bacterium]|nr:PD40 domain-containing protein [Phycisphaerae bacterium]